MRLDTESHARSSKSAMLSCKRQPKVIRSIDAANTSRPCEYKFDRNV